MSLIDRAGGLAGAVGMILILVFIGQVDEVQVEPEHPSALVAKAFAANREPARLGAYIGLIGVFFLVVFFARLYGALRDASGPSSWVPVMALGGGVLMAGILSVEIGLVFAISELSSYGRETQVVRFFVLWGWNSANLLAPPFALVVAGTTFVAWSVKAFPQWYRWTSVALLVLLLLIAGVMRAPGLGTAPGMLWVILTSLVLATRRGYPSPGRR